MTTTTSQTAPGRMQASESGDVIDVAGLRRSYGSVEVLKGVDFTVRDGEIFGLLGSNGAGKTTAVETIQGLRPADAGSIRVFGHDPFNERRALRPLLGAQLQSSALPERLKVGEALKLFTRLAGNVVDWHEIRDRWDLGALEGRSFGALSGGQKQRLFLALALVNRPRLVFLDELTQGLDAAARRQTWDLIEEVRQTGTTVVLVTHFMDEAERLCDRIGILHDGRIGFLGSPAELISGVGGPVRITFTVTETSRLAGLENVAGVVDVNLSGQVAELRCQESSCVPAIAALAQRGLEPADLRIIRPTLEDAFVALTTEGATP